MPDIRKVVRKQKVILDTTWEIVTRCAGGECAEVRIRPGDKYCSNCGEVVTILTKRVETLPDTSE